MDDLRSTLDSLTDAGWLLPALGLLVALDALIPFLPSGTSILFAGVIAASGRLDVAAVALVGAAGAYCGDNLLYSIGRRWGRRWWEARFAGRRRFSWIRKSLGTRPASVIITSRFIPVVRFVVMLTAGATGCAPWRFRASSLGAALIWATTMALSGYAGGATFGQRPLLAFAMALVVGSAAAFTVEVAAKRLRHLHDAPAHLQPLTRQDIS